MPYAISCDLFITEGLYLLSAFIRFTYPPACALATISLLSLYECNFFVCFFKKHNLSFSVWLISLGIMLSGSMHVATNGKVSFILCEYSCVCVCVSVCVCVCVCVERERAHFLFPFIYWWIRRLLSGLGYCCKTEHKVAYTSFQVCIFFFFR